MKVITIIVPIYNEEKSLPYFFKKIDPILKKTKEENQDNIDFRILIINDGSFDASELTIHAYQKNLNYVQLINLSRNFGKEAALTAGMEFAEGDAIIPMDVDLQDPPEVIAKLIKKWLEGALIVNAKRSDRSVDSLPKRLSANIFYKIFNLICDHNIPENVGDFRLIDRKVIDAINRVHDLSRCNKEIFSWVGFNPVEIEYAREARNEDTSKWSNWNLIKLSLDGLFSSSTLPLQIWVYIGLTLALFGFAYIAFIMCYALLVGLEVPGYNSTLVTILFFGSFNLLSLGMMGEYIGRIYKEVRHRPPYLISSSHGINTKKQYG